MPLEEYWRNKRVIVTGGTGFLGGHFVKKLNKLGSKVVFTKHKDTKTLGNDKAQKINLLDYRQTNKLLSHAEVVINCAALDGNAEFKLKHAAQIFDTNVRISSNILNAAKDNSLQDVVMISSTEIYSSLAPNPISEEDDFRRYDEHTLNGYVLSKRYGEILSELFHSEYGFRIYLPRPSNIYGPGDHFDKTTRVIPSFIKKVADNVPIEIWGDGSQTRQFIYVDDVVDSVLTMVEKKIIGKLNVSTDQSIGIHELARKIYKIMNRKEKIRLDTSKSIGASSRVLDVSKLYSKIGVKPISLDCGLQHTIDWYVNEYGSKKN